MRAASARAFAVAMLLVAGCGNSFTPTTGGAACVTASACGIYGLGVSSCTSVVALINEPTGAANFKFSPSEVACIANAGSDCTAAKKCLANGNTPASCSGVSDSCSGNVWQSCGAEAGSGGNNGVRLFDCASAGEMCVTSGGNTDCGFGTCSPNGATCSSDGKSVQHCDNGILHLEDCTLVGATCNPSGILGAHCRGNGAGCSGNSTLRCDGNTLVSCLDGQEGRYDCGRLSLGCYPKPNGGGFTCAAGSDCDPQNSPSTCVGNKLTFCNMGKSQTYDCGASGFTGCSPSVGCTK